jgi:AraC family transcriptional regulator
VSEPSSVTERRVARVLAYLARELDVDGADLSLDTLAGVAGMSKFHFHRQFAAITGTTVARLLARWRLKRASMTLAFARQARVSDVAQGAGYGSPEAFARAFRELQGQSPTEFRRAPAWEHWAHAFRTSHPSQERPMPEQEQFAVEVVQFPETMVAALEHRGAPATLMASVARFIEWRKASGASPAHRSHTYGVAFDDPGAVAPPDVRFDICGSVDAPVPPNSWGVVTKTIAGGACAVTTHRGSTDAIGATVMRLYREWLPGSGRSLRDAPLFFHYKRRMPDVHEPDQLTDVYLPLA